MESSNDIVAKLLADTQKRLAILEDKVEHMNVPANSNNSKQPTSSEINSLKEINNLKQSIKKITDEKNILEKDNNTLINKNKSLTNELNNLINENKKLNRLAYIDNKTQCLNENAFNRDYGTSKDITLYVFSIADQKKSNIKFGKKSGDKRIKTVANIISNNISQNVYRIMGDRFYVIDANRSVTPEIIEKIKSDCIDSQIEIKVISKDSKDFASLKELLNNIENMLIRNIPNNEERNPALLQNNPVNKPRYSDNSSEESENSPSIMDRFYPKEETVHVENENDYEVKDLLPVDDLTAAIMAESE